METFVDRYLVPKAVGEDIFGEHFPAREIIYDPQNKDLFLRMLRNYVNWKVEKGDGFHPEFEADRNRLWRYHKY